MKKTFSRYEHTDILSGALKNNHRGARKLEKTGLLNLKNVIFARFNNNIYCMVQSPSGEANCFAASQEIPRISRNPKVHYRTHKRPPPVSILGQPNPVHIPISHLLKIRPNIIHLSRPRSPQWSLSLRFSHQDFLLIINKSIKYETEKNSKKYC